MPELGEVVDLLQQVPLFDGLGGTDLAAVAGSTRCIEAHTDHFFFRQDAAADTVYVLNYGRVRLTQGHNGHQVLCGIVGPREMFGSVAVLADKSYAVSAQAVRWCQALAWNGQEMADLMAAYPRIAFNALRDLTERVQALEERYHELATERVEQRIAQALVRLAHRVGWNAADGLLIDVALSRQDVAELTGTTLYTVSRTFRTWQRSGLVDAGRQRVAILQPQRLMAIADGLAHTNSSDIRGAAAG